MDKSLIILLACMAGFDALSFYFGFIKPPRFLAYYSKSSFVVLTFLLIPFVCYVLWSQSTALGRLSDTGVVPHPSITNSVGILSGTIMKDSWLFNADAPPREVLDFYRDENNRPGWAIESESDVMLIFRNSGRKLTVAADREFDTGPTMILFKLDG